MNLKNLNPFKKIKELGLAKFSTIWVGQALSILGSSMSGFALTIWLWDTTGKASPMVIMSFIRLLAMILLVPFAGSIADRFNRKTVLIVSDAIGAFVTLFTLVLLLTGKLTVSFVYLVGFLNQIFNIFHHISYEAMKVQIVPPEQLGRAAGMSSFSDSFSGVLAPIVAAALIPLVGYAGVLVIDLVSFAFAFITICLVEVPNLKMPGQKRKNILKDIVEGFKFLYTNKVLTWIVINGTLWSFFYQFGVILTEPMLLARVGGNTLIYGYIRTIFSIVGIAGALILTFWGGPKKKRFYFSIFLVLGYSIGMVIVGLASNFVVWAIGGTIWYICAALSSIRNAFYATKVPANMQGRFFAVRMNLNNIVTIVPYLLTGILADKIFEPMMSNPSLASKFSWLVGSGKGSGMGLMMVLSGILSALVIISSLFIRQIREADTLLADVNNNNE